MDILKDVKVVDFTRMLAGPYATRLLADFGAEVIKIQCGKTAFGGEANDTAYFRTWNRNKRSITLDMTHPEAREILLRLTAVSDVVMENFSPRVMSNWGLAYDDLKQVNPGLIMVRMSGMGQTGPWRNMVAFGSTIQSLSGITSLTSYDKEEPLGPGQAYADHVAGIYGAIAVLAALENRDRTGQGRCIDLSEYEAMCTLMGPALMDVLVNHQDPVPHGNNADYVSAAPHGCYRCRGDDQWCVIAVSNETEWEGLCHAAGHGEWLADERFASIDARKDHHKELDPLIRAWTIEQRAHEVERLLQEAGVPAAVVKNAEDLADDPQLRARDYFVRLKHPILGEDITDTNPFTFKSFSTSRWKASPALGEANQYVFLDLLGLSEIEFSDYRKRGIIA
ncbi:MAG: CoA transferase [Desulfatiglans sp.]|jgi:crotonobetainyl-CoA:carnitine CoA-transferase CaiB-like acyl-CoA transferase|nr:CoA transferase [Desulfatiglans sp.]